MTRALTKASTTARANAQTPQRRTYSVRHLALKVLLDVLLNQHSLAQALPQQRQYANQQDTGLLQALCFGVLRHYFSLTEALEQCLSKPLRKKDTDVHTLLLIGLYEIKYMRTHSHALVNETVAVTKKIKKHWATSLVNAVLRNHLRALKQDDAVKNTASSLHHEHPPWLLEQLKKDWPNDWSRIVQANNQHPPMMLRVNPLKTSRQAYQKQLAEQGLNSTPLAHSPNGLCLEHPVSVDTLPFFQQGHVSVQDSSAQYAAQHLDLKPGLRVLDACAAPGGKTTHLIEIEPDLRVIALDIDNERLQKISDNIQRLQHKNIEVKTGDACAPENTQNSWWDGQLFDRILLDAPCSGSGVIRRHPDIKHLRQASDIQHSATQQHALLHALWPQLKLGGLLLYSTCSVLKQENSEVITAFMKKVACTEKNLTVNGGLRQPAGYQILPGSAPMNGDGFYFCCLEKI